jgi:hypothetical protein
MQRAGIPSVCSGCAMRLSLIRRSELLFLVTLAYQVGCASSNTGNETPTSGSSSDDASSGSSSGTNSGATAGNGSGTTSGSGSGATSGSGSGSTSGETSGSGSGETAGSSSGTSASGAEPADDDSGSDSTAPGDEGGADSTIAGDDSGPDSTVEAGGMDAGDVGAPDAPADGSDGSVADAQTDGSDGAVADASQDASQDAAVDARACGSVILTPTSATASANALQPASNAIDGNLATRWESIHGVDPQWIYIDFGAPVFVSEVQILWQNACATNYDIDVSDDAATWTVVKSVTGNTLQSVGAPADWTGADDQTNLNAVGRYLRINGTLRCTIYGYSIWEMRALGDTNPTCTP